MSRPPARRVVVKLGSGVLSGGTAALHAPTVRRLAAEVAAARAAGVEIVLVSSGAILSGRGPLGLSGRPSVQLKQAAAAVGQSRLMRAWEGALARRRLVAGQVLLTGDDLRDRARYLNARNTLLTLLRLGAVPVVNENDTVAVEEIKFGDNDGLSALVAALVDADLLVLLTDQDGVYTGDPRTDPDARLVRRVPAGERPAGAGGAGAHGTGGMASKVSAAAQAAAGGIPAVVASGVRPGTLADVLAGAETGTRFEAVERPPAKRRQWLAFASRPAGRIVVDAGARSALCERGKSLLASGVREVSGDFAAGDAVSLVAGDAEFARGLSNFSARDLARVKGLKTAQIEGVLGHKPADEVVHRDNMALL